MLRILIIIFCMACTPFLQAQETEDKTEVHRLVITDETEKPVFGVYVALKGKNRLLTTSDIDGECILHTAPLQPGDTIVFQGIGYKTQNIAWEELQQLEVVRLESLTFELEESTVYAITTKELLNKAMEKLKKLPKRTPPFCNFYGKAQYEKITEYHNRTLEYRREYGYYFTSGDVTPRDNWDQYFRSYFVPAYSARSYNLRTDASDSLTPLYITTEGIRFDAGTRKIFTLLRAVQLYGPLFGGIKSYEISPIESDSPDYVYAFQTKTSDYPAKNRITCKGTFEIDVERHVLKKISFDYIDYQLYRQILLSGQRKTASPFSTRAEIEIHYDEHETPYFGLCIQETYWKHDLGSDFVLVEQPSRMYPATGNLVEKEAFACYSYMPVRDELRDRNTLTKIHGAQRNPTGQYDPELFAALPVLLDNQKAKTELSEFEDLEDQFFHHSEKTYYPDNYMNGFNGVSGNSALFKEGREKIRMSIFELFPFPGYP